MYYPYLRGKQFELLALREFSEICGEDCKIIPIIEPVKKSFNSLKTAFAKMQEKGMLFSLILNPQVGDLTNEHDELVEFTAEILRNSKQLLPALFITNSNAYSVFKLVEECNFQNVLLICQDNVDHEHPDFMRLLDNKRFGFFIINGDNRSLKRKLARLEKNTIRIDNQFNPQKKNADYIHIPEERFTEEHRCFEEDGFEGFSDYTVLDSDFNEGGRLPYAVAMHFTYEKNAEEIWVRHFVSDTNDDNTNIQGKFGEAAEKTVDFFDDARHFNSTAIEELKNYYNNNQYPGLGVLKKLSIKHHLELINKVLTEEAD